MTITAQHTGLKIRSQSNRRYVLVAEYTLGQTKPSACIVKRSDSAQILLTEARRIRGRGVVAGRYLTIHDTAADGAPIPTI